MDNIYVLYSGDDDNHASPLEAFKQNLKYTDVGKQTERFPSGFNIGPAALPTTFGDDYYFNERANLLRSKILIAIFNYDFYSNKICREFWRDFWDKQASIREDLKRKNSDVELEQTIFPIIIGSKSDAFKPDDNDASDRIKIFNQANELDFLKAPSASEDPVSAEIFFANLTRDIKYSLENINKSAAHYYDEESVEQRVIVEALEELSDDGYMDVKYLSRQAKEDARLNNVTGKISLKEKVLDAIGVKPTKAINGKDRPVICAIYTGGTVGMIRDRTSIVPDFINASPQELLQNLHRLPNLECDVHLYAYKATIDSSNAKSSKWIEIAKIINLLQENYFGFVVIHGANTLAYTASALSFMSPRLKTPIVLTGAELPLSDMSREAETNVIKSIELASGKYGSLIPEVCILYGSNLMRGNRATKKNALHTAEGFYSPNFRNLGNIATDRTSIDYTMYEDGDDKDNEQANGRLNIPESLDANIMIYDVYPDMNMDTFVKFCDKSLDALIIRTYGTGVVPDDKETGFIDHIKDLIASKTIVVSLTQSPIGSVELRLHETNAQLFDLGVINGGDLTTEAAYCKLKYLFGTIGKKVEVLSDDGTSHFGFDDEKKYEIIGDKMMLAMNGEMSMETHHIRFRNNATSLTAKEPYDVISDEFFGFNVKDLQAAVLRFRGIRTESKSINANEVMDIDIKMNTTSGDVMFGKWVQNKKLNNHKDITKIENINVDVLSSVRKFIGKTSKEGNKIALKLYSRSHNFTYDSLSIVLLTGGVGKK